jgi:hypothetical protein
VVVRDSFLWECKTGEETSRIRKLLFGETQPEKESNRSSKKKQLHPDHI